MLDQDADAVSISYNVLTAAGSNDNVDVGIYDSALAKIVSSGSTAGKLNATGRQSVSVTTSNLSAGGIYYVAFACVAVGTTAAILNAAAFYSQTDAMMFGTAAPQLEAFHMAAGPLPGTLVPVAGGIIVLPQLVVDTA